MSAWKVARLGFGEGKLETLAAIAVATDCANVMRLLTLLDILRIAIGRAAMGFLEGPSGPGTLPGVEPFFDTRCVEMHVRVIAVRSGATRRPSRCPTAGGPSPRAPSAARG